MRVLKSPLVQQVEDIIINETNDDGFIHYRHLKHIRNRTVVNNAFERLGYKRVGRSENGRGRCNGWQAITKDKAKVVTFTLNK